MNATAAPLRIIAPVAAPAADAIDDGFVIELFDQWTGPAESPGSARLCWYTRSDAAA